MVVETRNTKKRQCKATKDVNVINSGASKTTTKAVMAGKSGAAETFKSQQLELGITTQHLGLHGKGTTRYE